jgi:hypothetical protein
MVFSFYWGEETSVAFDVAGTAESTRRAGMREGRLELTRTSRELHTNLRQVQVIIKKLIFTLGKYGMLTAAATWRCADLLLLL